MADHAPRSGADEARSTKNVETRDEPERFRSAVWCSFDIRPPHVVPDALLVDYGRRGVRIVARPASCLKEWWDEDIERIDADGSLVTLRPGKPGYFEHVVACFHSMGPIAGFFEGADNG